MDAHLADLIRTAIVALSFCGGIWAFFHNQVESRVQSSTQNTMIKRDLETIQHDSIELKTEVSAINNRLTLSLIDINKTLGSLEGKIDAITKKPQ